MTAKPSQIDSAGSGTQLPGEAPADAQRANGGACRCASGDALSWPLRQDRCTCIWNEVTAAVLTLAYGGLTDDRVIAFAPIVATLVRDAAYQARDEALARRLTEWPGTRASFASQYGLHRSRLYQLGLHHQEGYPQDPVDNSKIM